MSSKKNRKPKTKENLLSPEQVDKVLSVISSQREDFVFKGILYTGLRNSEFLHMNKRWINFNRDLLRVPGKQECNCKGCKYARRKIRSEANKKIDKRMELRLDGYWVPKTASSERTIPIVDEAKEVFYPFFKKYDSILEVFPFRQYINNILSRLQRKSGVKLFPHCLRGTFATMLAIKGFSPYEIQEALGWADIGVAMHYIKLSGAGLKNAFEEKWARVYD